MDRRRLLGSVGAAALSLTAGCTDVLSGDDYPTDSFEGETVPLAPLEDVYGWWDADDARFVDTRGQNQYDASHVPGAVLSSPFGDEEADPTDDWDRDVRIVTYCDCPHSLAVQRASALLSEGFEDVYALDEGYLAWEDANYPVASNDPDAATESYTITGTADPEHAGEYVQISTASGDNYEIAAIGDDGSYEATIRFPDLTPESVLVVHEPTDRREGSLAELGDSVTAV
ncbi:rhodanese-like domain-containing protein [Halobacteria archaeon AArc-dxtr1]|nr:rhodanese-like domain-containing protein [Halobacteria archaeon AArc-dxtr1]